MATAQVMPYSNDWNYGNGGYEHGQYHQGSTQYTGEGYAYGEQTYSGGQEGGYENYDAYQGGDYHQENFAHGGEYAQEYQAGYEGQQAYDTHGYDQVGYVQGGYENLAVGYEAQSSYAPPASSRPQLAAPVAHHRESGRGGRHGNSRHNNNNNGNSNNNSHGYESSRGYSKRSSPVRSGYRGSGRHGGGGAYSNYRNQSYSGNAHSGRAGDRYGKNYVSEYNKEGANWKGGKGGKGKGWNQRDNEDGGYRCELPQLAAEAGVDDPRIETAAWRAYVVEVSFRMRADTELFHYRAELAKGATILTSADRGYDLGFVENCWKVDEAPHVPKPARPDDFHVVFRPATPREMSTLATQQPNREKEAVAKATDILFNLVPNYPQLSDMVFSAAVFQYDGRKLTLYYSTSSQDYKYYGPLLKPLFHTFGCRIWLQKVSSKDDVNSRSDAKSHSRSSASDAQSLSSEPRSDDLAEKKSADGAEKAESASPSPSHVHKHVSRICTPPLKPKSVAYHSALTPCSQPSPRRHLGLDGRVDWAEE